MKIKPISKNKKKTYTETDNHIEGKRIKGKKNQPYYFQPKTPTDKLITQPENFSTDNTHTGCTAPTGV